MRVSIIIVSWNVRELLRRCLASIATHRPSFPIEVIVIDNGSDDGSPEMIRESFPAVKLIQNTDNKGFAAACNQGIVGASGEYCFFLNPDAEITQDTLPLLVQTLDENTDAALVAPQILNPDGSVQHSIARFPTPLSQLLLFLKLNRVVPDHPALRSYRADDFPYDGTLQDVEQPMGAAMMIRSSTLRELGNFDKRFFIWYEEVDLCKRIRDAGYRILYQGAVQVMHHSAKSFVQHDVLRKQVTIYTSARQYLEKHFGWRAWYATLPMRIFTTVLGSLLSPLRGRTMDVWNTYRHIIVRTFLAIAVVELFSYLGYFSETIRSIGFVSIVLVTLAVSCIRLEYGIAFAFAELIIGSKGYLFAHPAGDSLLSVRMGIFASVLLAWIITLIAKKVSTPFTFFKSQFFPIVLLLAAAYAYGVAKGFFSNDKALLFRDANAWLYFLLLFPLYDAIRSREQIMRLLAVCLGAIAAQTAKVFAILYVMSHKGFGYDIMYSFYRWVRTTGVGEVTQMTDHFYRIFLQGQIYSVILFFILLTYLFVSRKCIGELALRQGFWMLLVGTVASILLSFSRSFWMAIAATGLLFLGVFVRTRAIFSVAWRMALVCGTSLLVIASIALFPFPSGDLGIGFDALAKRFQDVDSEAAARSRWELLPELTKTIASHPFAGYGFGKTVTYTSHDPRVLAVHPTGTYTTYAFEWGYLDIWVKLGLFGLLSLLVFLGQILIEGWRAAKMTENVSLGGHAFLLGLWFGVIALTFVHIFTPYIVHPLGIGILMIAILCFERFTKAYDSRSKIAGR